MRQTKRSLAIALALSMSIIGFGKSRSSHARLVHLQELRGAISNHMNITPLDRAFLDARTILDQSNACSQFFGTEAPHVLTELSKRVEKRSSDNHGIAFLMSGPFAIYVNGQNGALYRLFETVEVNTNGPFYKSKVFMTDPFVPHIGSFPPNTRQVRVLILLHELAHLIEGSDRKWLIPDDGGNLDRSRSNTRIVESKCGRQIRAL
jgi:hypothetical protein